MKKQAIAAFLLISLSTFAQSNKDVAQAIKPLEEKVKSLESDNRKLKTEMNTLNATLSKRIDSIARQAQANSDTIRQVKDNLNTKITTTATVTNEKISQNALFGIIGVLAAILLSGLLYWLLNKKQTADKSDFIAQLSETKAGIEASLVKEFGKQTELMDGELQLLAQQKQNLQSKPNAEPDHSLALKLASEINLIERNINLMDVKTKGLKQLHASVGKLKDNLSANGYEMPELLGKPFNSGMKVIIASSIPDENLEKDAEIITKILIPQVNYNNKMIQTAQIEVSVGY
jgi:hypothetical protein